MRIVMQRYRPRRMSEYEQSRETQGEVLRTYVPIGCDVVPPEPDANLHFIQERDGWWYVYWILEDA